MTEAWADSSALTEGRHARQQRLAAWNQAALTEARVLVAGCGTLGNEVLKNLALTGIGALGLIDHDLVEEPNLGTSVLFRGQDIGRPKAAVAAERLAELAPGIVTQVLALDLTTHLGEGAIAGYDLVLGCLDGVHARWKLNRLCLRAGVPWIDAGIEDFAGQIAFFDGRDGPCYECGMTASMWDRLNQRRRCVLPASRPGSRPVATSPALASLVASLQVHEAVTWLQRQRSEHWNGLASGDRVLASLAPYRLAVVHGRRSPACLAHHSEETAWTPSPYSHANVTLHRLLAETSMHRLELDWELVCGLHCERCGTAPACIPDFHLAASDLVCPTCGDPRQPLWTHAIAAGDELASRTPAALGVPDRGWLTLTIGQNPTTGQNLMISQDRPLICRLTAAGDVRA